MWPAGPIGTPHPAVRRSVPPPQNHLGRLRHPPPAHRSTWAGSATPAPPSCPPTPWSRSSRPDATATGRTAFRPSDNDAADHLTGLHGPESVIDLIEADASRHHGADVEAAGLHQ